MLTAAGGKLQVLGAAQCGVTAVCGCLSGLRAMGDRCCSAFTLRDEVDHAPYIVAGSLCATLILGASNGLITLWLARKGASLCS